MITRVCAPNIVRFAFFRKTTGRSVRRSLRFVNSVLPYPGAQKVYAVWRGRRTVQTPFSDRAGDVKLSSSRPAVFSIVRKTVSDKIFHPPSELHCPAIYLHGHTAQLHWPKTMVSFFGIVLYVINIAEYRSERKHDDFIPRSIFSVKRRSLSLWDTSY